MPTNHKTVIIGHSSTVFSNLSNAKDGEVITFDDHNYRISEIKILEKRLIDMDEIVSETSVNTVILMTCYGKPLGGQDYTHRLIITAEEI